MDPLTEHGWAYTDPGCACGGKTGIWRREGNTVIQYKNGRYALNGKGRMNFSELKAELERLQLW